MLVAGSKAAGVCPVVVSSRERSAAWEPIVAPVEPFLETVNLRLAEQVDAFEPEIAGIVRDALTHQGKQLRPALVALSAEATGGLNDSLVTVATIIEIVHVATLIHDDVMDEARIRRRRLTLAAQMGNALAVLAGDCLFAHALQLAAGFPTPDVCRAVAAATRTVCSGETLQTLQEGQISLSREEYFRILRMKTAELFALSCELGAQLSGAGEFEQRALREYGLALGTAYQVYDDCLDLFGEERAVGKSLGTDLAMDKMTLPVIVALERATAAESAEAREWLGSWQPRHLPKLLEFLDRHGAFAEAAGVLQSLCRSARRALTGLPAGPGVASLKAVTEYLIQQAAALDGRRPPAH